MTDAEVIQTAYEQELRTLFTVYVTNLVQDAVLSSQSEENARIRFCKGLDLIRRTRDLVIHIVNKSN